MNKKKIGIVAKKLNHSLSPFIHNYWSRNNNFIYRKYEIQEKNIDKFFYNYRKDKRFVGFNITIPYKENFIGFCDKITARAKKIGSVNLIYKKNKIIFGDNTDVIGFSKTFKSLKIRNTKSVLLVGAGGAARAILYFLNQKNIEKIDIFATSIRREENLKKKFKFDRFLIRSSHLKKRYDLIINASSAGMTKKNRINRNILNLVKNAKGVIDIVYNPIETDLLKKAKKHDIKFSGGLKMLLEQAKPSYEIWSGKKIEIDNKIYQILVYKLCPRLQLQEI